MPARSHARVDACVHFESTSMERAAPDVWADSAAWPGFLQAGGRISFPRPVLGCINEKLRVRLQWIINIFLRYLAVLVFRSQELKNSENLNEEKAFWMNLDD